MTIQIKNGKLTTSVNDAGEETASLAALRKAEVELRKLPTKLRNVDEGDAAKQVAKLVTDLNRIRLDLVRILK